MYTHTKKAHTTTNPKPHSPHNPTGKVFTRGEMEAIASLVQATNSNVVVVSDEVYKFTVFEPGQEVGRCVLYRYIILYYLYTSRGMR